MRSEISLRPLQKTLVVLFCIFHCAAVAIYLTPRPASPLLSSIYTRVWNLTGPYILSFSQWQAWNIFSPDPLRKSTVYRIDRNIDDDWKPPVLLDYDHLSWMERAKTFKVLERLESGSEILIEPYLLSFCPANPAGTILRLTAVSRVLPIELEKLSKFSTLRFPTDEWTMGEVTCPSA